MNNLTNPLLELKQSLQAVDPKTETTQLITYTLIAAAIVVIFVYHYLKNQENSH